MRIKSVHSRSRETPPSCAANGASRCDLMGDNMANTTQTSNPGPEEVFEEPVPVMQQLLDNPFLLLFLGIAMPTVLYIVWGVMEIVSIPVGK